MKQKHYDVIIAWAEGKPIQVKNTFGEWVTAGQWPSFHDSYEFRVKPEDIVIYVPAAHQYTDLERLKQDWKYCAAVKITKDEVTKEVKSIELVED